MKKRARKGSIRIGVNALALLNRAVKWYRAVRIMRYRGTTPMFLPTRAQLVEMLIQEFATEQYQEHEREHAKRRNRRR